MPDVSPVDYTSPVGRVRKYIPDILQLQDPAAPLAPKSYMWADDAITSFIADETPYGETVAPRTAIWRAAAAIMVATANNENLILKKLVTDDLQTDGPAVAKALLQAAEVLRARASREEILAENEEIFLIVPYASQDSYVRPVRPIWGL